MLQGKAIIQFPAPAGGSGADRQPKPAIAYRRQCNRSLASAECLDVSTSYGCASIFHSVHLPALRAQLRPSDLINLLQRP